MFEKIIEMFLKFPGIGPRQAKRFAYFLAGAGDEFVEELSKLILEVKGSALQCPSCFHFFETRQAKQCVICSNLNRDKSLLMVVEKDVDLETIEKSGVYDGVYFILGGVISLSKSNGGQNNLRFKELFNKVQKAPPGGVKKIKEVILATSATIEGENTARYAGKILEPLKVKITRLGRGLSTGTELEYIDSETMNNALKNRK